jgi:hypothetical protein
MASKGLPHPVSPTISVTRFSFIFWTILSRDARTGSGAIVDSLCDSFSSPLSYKNLSHTLSLSLSRSRSRSKSLSEVSFPTLENQRKW